MRERECERAISSATEGEKEKEGGREERKTKNDLEGCCSLSMGQREGEILHKMRTKEGENHRRKKEKERREEREEKRREEKLFQKNEKKISGARGMRDSESKRERKRRRKLEANKDSGTRPIFFFSPGGADQ